MISPETHDTLTMLRRAYRPHAPGPTKRPVGGRPNPCALHCEPAHPLAAIMRASRAHKRKQQIRSTAVPGWKTFSLAVQSGDIPIGSPLTEKDLRRAIGFGATYGMEMLSLQLSSNREPVRIRQIGVQKWVASLV